MSPEDRLARLEQALRRLTVLVIALLLCLIVLGGWIMRKTTGERHRIETEQIVIRDHAGDRRAFFGLDSLPGEGSRVEATILRAEHVAVPGSGNSSVDIGGGIEGGIGLQILDYDGKVRVQAAVGDEGNGACLQLIDPKGGLQFSSTPADPDSTH